jgi:hypothetical protein
MAILKGTIINLQNITRVLHLCTDNIFCYMNVYKFKNRYGFEVTKTGVKFVYLLHFQKVVKDFSKFIFQLGIYN